MRITINGEVRDVASRDIFALVAELNLVPEVTLVEHNGTALVREEWAARGLEPNDRLEIIRIVAGG